MRILFIPILLTLPSLSDTYIHNSIITNSTVGSNISMQQGSGILATKNVMLRGEFNKINIKIPADITIHQSSKKAITLKMEKDFIDNVLFEVNNSTLNIGTKGSINSRLKIEIVVSTASINALSVSSTADVTVDGFSVKSFELFSAGTSKVTFLSGDIGTLSLQSKGTSQINLEQIQVKRAKIVSQGTSRTNINVSDNLTVKLSGISKVEYSGNPKITQKLSGLGKLIKAK
ncbi:hypothetical protein MNB_SV-12-383 [hydrothermal vent metagenome]|uniref:Putative auto-transporter adhesin head GIN domain-containing protein n=1 Tax=hydrothermal vent metagenome TaxID=652676 RepID=A0A1W1CCI5_9ZZZZ